MDLDRAKAVVNTAEAIIHSAQVEVKYIEVTGQGEQRAQKFFGLDPQLPVTISHNGKRNLPA